MRDAVIFNACTGLLNSTNRLAATIPVLITDMGDKSGTEVETILGLRRGTVYEVQAIARGFLGVNAAANRSIYKSGQYAILLL